MEGSDKAIIPAEESSDLDDDALSFGTTSEEDEMPVPSQQSPKVAKLKVSPVRQHAHHRKGRRPMKRNIELENYMDYCMKNCSLNIAKAKISKYGKRTLASWKTDDYRADSPFWCLTDKQRPARTRDKTVNKRKANKDTRIGSEEDISFRREYRCLFTNLWDAARRNELDEVDRYISSGQGVNSLAPGPNKETPLHAAAMGGHCDMVRLLLELGGDLNAVDDVGNTPLHIAARNNKYKVARLLVQRKAKHVAKNDAGKTARQIAEEHKFAKVVKAIPSAWKGSALIKLKMMRSGFRSAKSPSSVVGKVGASLGKDFGMPEETSSFPSYGSNKPADAGW